LRLGASMTETNDRGPTLIRSSAGWTAVSDTLAAGGNTVAEALANFWRLARGSDMAAELNDGATTENAA